MATLSESDILAYNSESESGSDEQGSPEIFITPTSVSRGPGVRSKQNLLSFSLANKYVIVIYCMVASNYFFCKYF